MTAYTIEIYAKDARTKQGERLIEKIDYTDFTREKIESAFSTTFPADKYRFEIHETFVTKKSLDVGYGSKEFQERYDTPYYCSPSSETYWSM